MVEKGGGTRRGDLFLRKKEGSKKGHRGDLIQGREEKFT